MAGANHVAHRVNKNIIEKNKSRNTGDPPTIVYGRSRFGRFVHAFRNAKAAHVNATIGIGLGSRGRLGAYNGTGGDFGVDAAHVMLSFGTDRANLQTTIGGLSANASQGGTIVGGDGYLFRGNIGYNGNGYDFMGSQRGFFSNPYKSSGYINNDPKYIIDLGIFEAGFESNYGIGEFFDTIVEGTKNYIRDMIYIPWAQ